MRYALLSDDPAESKFLEERPEFRALFDPLLPMLHTRCLLEAARLGLFEAIGGASTPAEELAERLDLDALTLEMLLRVLVSAGYVETDGERFALGELARHCLLPEGPMPLDAWFRFHALHWDLATRLGDVLRSGRGLDSHDGLGGPRAWADYQEAMLQSARPAAPALAERIAVPDGATHLLDLGGGHGLYGAALCRLHPPLRSTVLDLPAAIEHAVRLAEGEGIADVVEHRAGDVRTAELGEGAFDVIIAGNLLHHLAEEDIGPLLERCHRALRPSGTMVVWGFRRPGAAEPCDLIADGLALLWRLGSGSRCLPVDEQLELLRRAGFHDARSLPTPAPAQMLLTARRG